MIRELVEIPLMVDAGVGTASDAALAMELGRRWGVAQHRGGGGRGSGGHGASHAPCGRGRLLGPARGSNAHASCMQPPPRRWMASQTLAHPDSPPALIAITSRRPSTRAEMSEPVAHGTRLRQGLARGHRSRAAGWAISTPYNAVAWLDATRCGRSLGWRFIDAKHPRCARPLCSACPCICPAVWPVPLAGRRDLGSKLPHASPRLNAALLCWGRRWALWSPVWKLLPRSRSTRSALSLGLEAVPGATPPADPCWALGGRHPDPVYVELIRRRAPHGSGGAG